MRVSGYRSATKFIVESWRITTLQPDSVPPELDWPQWEWVLGKATGSLAFLFGLLSYFVPLLGKIPPLFWLTLGTVLVLLWLVVPLGWYLIRAAHVAYRRCRQYPKASAYAKEQNRELSQARARLEEVLPYISFFEVKDVLYECVVQGHRKMYIVVAKHEETKLYRGDTLQVLGVEDDKRWGTFTVTQDREHDYYALGIDVDPLWRGSVYQDGSRQQYPPPGVVAKLVQRSGEDDK